MKAIIEYKESFMLLTLEISQADIDKAVIAHSEPFEDTPSCCPVAQAFKRAFPYTTDIQVGFCQATVINREYRVVREDRNAMLSFTLAEPQEWASRSQPTTLL